VIVLFTLLYFLLALIPFLFVKLTDPTAARLLRGLFRVCFLLIAGASGMAAIAFVATGRPGFAVGMAGLAIFAILARRWFLERLDTRWRASAAGDVAASLQLRRLHFGGMAVVVAQLVGVAGSMQFVI
jgi:hypothetical protein